MNTTRTPNAPFEKAADLEFQRRQWDFERFAGMTMTALVVFAGLGLFGSGPLDVQRLHTPTLDLEYSRFLRRDAFNEIRLTVRTNTVQTTTTKFNKFIFSLNREYLERNHPESIEPEPESVTLKSERQEFNFATLGPGPFVVTLRLRPTQPGMLIGKIRLEPNQAIEFAQFVYP